MKWYKLCIILWFPCLGYAQDLQGKVVDQSSGGPLVAANVFIAHSSKGTLTDENGQFLLTKIPESSFELVVSHLGYETLIRSYDPAQVQGQSLDLVLAPRTVDLTEVSITALKEKKRKRYFKRFQSAFLGAGPNAGDCHLLNPEVLDYRLKGDQLEVTAGALLRISNRATGYELLFLLENFTQEGSRTSYSGKPLFRELKPKDDQQVQNWQKRRSSTYRGSQRHFFRSLLDGALVKEGFIIYNARLKNQSEFETLGPASVAHILHESARGDPELRLQQFLKVVYTKAEKDNSRWRRMDAATQLGRPAEQGMISQERASALGQRLHPISYLFARKSRIGIQASGIPLEPALLIAYGHWATEGIADLLPWDYLPPTDQKEERSQDPDPVLNGFRLNNLLIPAVAIRKGGPPRDGIPAIDRPSFTTDHYTDFLSEKELVLGVALGAKAKAYPLKIMDRHEIVNDQLAGLPITVTYCPLCGSGMAFLAEVEGLDRTFGVSGLLYNSDVLLYDRQTESLWSQIRMQAVSGESSAQKLSLLPTYQTSWGEWKKQHPNTLVLTTNTGYSRNYESLAYKEYRESEELMFPVAEESKRLRRKDWVLGVELNGSFKAYPLKALREENTPLKDRVGGKLLLVHYNPSADSAYITDENGNAVPATTLYWFAWYAFHPNTKLWPD